MRCELCGKEAQVFLKYLCRGNEIRTAFCDDCDGTPEASALMDKRCEEVEPTQQYLDDLAKPRLYVVMQSSIPKDHSFPETAEPVAVFIDEKKAEDHVEGLRTEGYLRTEWSVVEVTLEDGDIP